MAINVNIQIGGPKESKRPENLHEPRKLRRKDRKFKKYFALFLITVFAIVLASIIFSTLKTKHTKNTYNKQFLALQNETDFPLYYPKDLPDGYSLVPNSVAPGNGGTVFSSYKYKDGSTYLITEQQRPPLMERVTKTDNVSTPIGSAYIANLNGAYTGIVLTEKTLIIISSASAKSNAIKPLITALQPVK